MHLTNGPSMAPRFSHAIRNMAQQSQPGLSQTGDITFGARRSRRVGMAGALMAGLALLSTGCSSISDHLPGSKTEKPGTTPTSQTDNPQGSTERSPAKTGSTGTATFDLSKYENRAPGQWGLNTPGSISGWQTREKAVALTFDFCGTSASSKGYDAKLIAYLRANQIPATLFVTKLWTDANPVLFQQLAADPLFEIENHGTKHVPVTVEGKSAYNIKGTDSPQEIMDEIEVNARNLELLTGRKPQFFRPGTAHSDEVANELARDLGQPIVGFTVNGDAGAGLPAEGVVAELKKVRPGAIVLAHGNHPEGETAEGMAIGLEELRQKGFTFYRLNELPLS